MHRILGCRTVLGAEAGQAVGVGIQLDPAAFRRVHQLADDACRRIVAPIIYEDDFVEDAEDRAQSVRDLGLFVPDADHRAHARTPAGPVEREVVLG